MSHLRRQRSSSKSTKGNGAGKEKSKSSAKDKKLIPKNTNRKNVGRSKQDDELDLLQDLFLKELQKSSKKRLSKGRLKFERKPNKENKRLRGNVFVISFPERSSFRKKINLINNWDGSELKYYVDRFSKLPQAIQVILTTKKVKELFARASRISSFDFVVNVPNTKKFILETMFSFQDNYIEYIEDTELRDSAWVYNPGKIKMVTVRFIY